MYGLLSALLIVSVLLTGCLGGGTEVDERKDAEEAITALLNKYAKTFHRDPEAHAALFYAYPFEVTVGRGGSAGRETMETPDEFIELLEEAGWNPDRPTSLEIDGTPDITFDDNYKTAVVEVKIILTSGQTVPYTRDVKYVNNTWLLSTPIVGIFVN